MNVNKSQCDSEQGMKEIIKWMKVRPLIHVCEEGFQEVYAVMQFEHAITMMSHPLKECISQRFGDWQITLETPNLEREKNQSW